MALGTGENTSTQSLMVYCFSQVRESVSIIFPLGGEASLEALPESCLQRKPEEIKTKNSAKFAHKDV